MSAQKVILIHGLFCNGRFFAKVERKLRKLGYNTLAVSYPALRQSVSQGARDLEYTIRKFKGDSDLYFVGHSLGGIMIRYLHNFFPDIFENSRVVTIGTPHTGSVFARKVHQKLPTFVLGKSWENALDGNIPAWNPEIPTLSIAGTKTSILNFVMRVFAKDEVNDGQVGLLETQLPEIQAYQTFHKPHTKLCFYEPVLSAIDDWFKQK